MCTYEILVGGGARVEGWSKCWGEGRVRGLDGIGKKTQIKYKKAHDKWYSKWVYVGAHLSTMYLLSTLCISSLYYVSLRPSCICDPRLRSFHLSLFALSCVLAVLQVWGREHSIRLEGHCPILIR